MTTEGKGRGAAFFDLDKTLMAGSSGMMFGRAARRAGMVSRRQMASWGAQHLRYRLRGENEKATRQVLGQVKESLKGVPEQEIAEMVPEMLAALLPRIYPQMLDEVRSHQDAGRATFIISAAGHGLVEVLAEVLEMDGGIGTRYATTPEGILTGELDGPFIHGEGKVEAMQQFAAEHNIDLAASHAYSDSANDLPMLRAVGHPVVVNPDPELLTVAKKEGWRILRFEKLGRKLAILGATILAAIGGGAGLATRRRAPKSRRPLARRR